MPETTLHESVPRRRPATGNRMNFLIRRSNRFNYVPFVLPAVQLLPGARSRISLEIFREIAARGDGPTEEVKYNTI